MSGYGFEVVQASLTALDGTFNALAGGGLSDPLLIGGVAMATLMAAIVTGRSGSSTGSFDQAPREGVIPTKPTLGTSAGAAARPEHGSSEGVIPTKPTLGTSAGAAARPESGGSPGMIGSQRAIADSILLGAQEVAKVSTPGGGE